MNGKGAARQPDVAVVGAGIVGLSTALFLAEGGARVVVIERESIGCAASGASAGMVSPFVEVEGPPALEALAEAGQRIHETLSARLRDEVGTDVHFRPLQVLRPAFDEGDAERLRKRAGERRGWSIRWLDGAEARALEPLLSPRALGALCAPDEAQVDSYRLTVALAQAVERRGVEIRYGEARGLMCEGDRVVGVSLRREVVRAGSVLLAAGPWTGLMAEWTGWPIPVIPLRGEILHLRQPGLQLQCCIIRGGNYVLLKPDGLVKAGTTEERVGFRAQPTVAGRRRMGAAAARLVPALREAAVVGHTACLRPLSADLLPILGPVPGWEGLFLATGHGRRGILLGPISG
ncbi:MAG: FAD-dependent oxidoreductase, partial [Chloroflexi bacterium]|nr:FAD-dependent oxidoreductase [Chloroflexota bacterium]